MDAPWPSYDDVRAARARIFAHVVHTPVLRSEALDRRAGTEVYLKCENLQRGGAFKARGAMNRMLQLTQAERRRGVVAYSSGNHGLAVSLAARDLGVSAVIVMPRDAPHAKLDAVRASGADLRLYDRESGDREALAQELVEREGRILVPPFNDASVIAGAGTAALELLEAVPNLEAIVAPVGGGGLLSGTAIAAHGWDPRIAVYGVEPSSAADVKTSLERGAITAIADNPTIADGLRTVQTCELVFSILRVHVAGIATVDDTQLIDALELLLLDAKVLAEPSGAAGVAAVMQGGFPHFRPSFQRVGVIVSGGNVDGAQLLRYLGGAA